VNKKFPTKPGHFSLFNKTVVEWQKRLGLMDYLITVKHVRLNWDTGASSLSDAANRVASISLNTHWPHPPSEMKIKQAAAHEVFHVLLAEMRKLACSRFLRCEEIDRAEEAVVRRLESLVDG
jgi:hypothetical protein